MSAESAFELAVRPAAPSDLAVAAQLRCEMSLEAGNDYDATRPGWRDRFVAYFGERHAAGLAQVFLASDGATPIGMLSAAVLDHYRDPVLGVRTGYVYAVFVRPAWRGRGVARALLGAATAWLRERGCTLVRLRTNASARAMYEHLGFTPTSEMELPLTEG